VVDFALLIHPTVERITVRMELDSVD
jgi:hypothetical protein